MASKICPACLGTGSYLGTQWVRGESGDYHRVVVRVRCEACRSADFNQRKSEILDGLFCWLLLLALSGYASFQLYVDPSGLDEWLRVAAALLATIFAIVLFRDAIGRIRILRWSTLLLMASAMITDVTLHLVHF